MSDKVIFLDFDGVLLNMATKYHHADPVCVAQLNRIVETAGAVIVVSSSWRGAKLASVADKLLEWGVTGKVIGQTPRLERVSSGGVDVAVERGLEIQAWLDQHSGVKTFVILDDDKDMAHLLPRLVRTASLIGLTEADAERAIAMLTTT